MEGWTVPCRWWLLYKNNNFKFSTANEIKVKIYMLTMPFPLFSNYLFVKNPMFYGYKYSGNLLIWFQCVWCATLLYSIKKINSDFMCMHVLVGHISYLCDQNICYSVNSIISVTGWNKTFSLAFFEARQKMCVKLKEVFQVREQTFQPSRVHLKVFLQLSDVYMQQYL